MDERAASPPVDRTDDPPLAKQLREELVRGIRGGVHDEQVLRAMREVPRHWFVRGHGIVAAYADHPLSIGHEATISQPSLVAIMSAALELSGTERVLEIGAGSGYLAAVLGRLAGHVDTVELVPALAASAAKTLAAIGSSNVDVHTGDGWAGWPAGAPYDRIVVTAAPDVVPVTLLEQLADGGLMIIPVGSQARDQRLERWVKHGPRFTRTDLGAVRFVPMVHASSDPPRDPR
jgi:protein-L-isoaspartate(D-aspartate) O-methyltransferase